MHKTIHRCLKKLKKRKGLRTKPRQRHRQGRTKKNKDYPSFYRKRLALKMMLFDFVSQKIAFSLSLVWHNRSRFPASARPRIQRGLEGGDPYQRPGSEAAQCALRERTLADFLGFGRLPQLQPELRQVKYAKKISPYTPKGLVTHNSTDLYRHSELSCCELT